MKKEIIIDKLERGVPITVEADVIDISYDTYGAVRHYLDGQELSEKQMTWVCEWRARQRTHDQ